MGQIYTASFTGVAISVAQDIFELTAPADAVLRILSAHLGQSSDYGDAAAEGLRIRWVRGEGATVGSGGSTVTPAPHMAGFGASGATARINDTTIMTAGGGSLTTVLPAAFNVQIGYFYNPIPEEMLIVSASDKLALELIAAPTDAITCEGHITWEEIGG